MQYDLYNRVHWSTIFNMLQDSSQNWEDPVLFDLHADLFAVISRDPACNNFTLVLQPKALQCIPTSNSSFPNSSCHQVNNRSGIQGWNTIGVEWCISESVCLRSNGTRTEVGKIDTNLASIIDTISVNNLTNELEIPRVTTALRHRSINCTLLSSIGESCGTGTFEELVVLGPAVGKLIHRYRWALGEPLEKCDLILINLKVIKFCVPVPLASLACF